MCYQKLFVFVVVFLGVVWNSAFARESKLFHFAYVNQFLLDDPEAEATWEKTNSAPAVANFENHIYIAWKGLDNRVNLCMVGRTDYVDFNDSTKTTKKKIIFNDSTNNTPALVVVDGKLVLLYIQKKTNMLEYSIIDTAGSINYKTGSPIDLRPYLPTPSSIFDGISACKYTDSTFVAGVTTVSTVSRAIQAFTFRINNRDKLFINNVFQLSEESYYMPSLCYIEDNLVGFGIMDKNRNPRFFAYHVDVDSIGVNYTYKDGGSSNSPFIYKKENEEDIHLLWKGIAGDQAIYEASFTVEDVEFSQFKLTDDFNQMYSNYAPIVFPLNDFYYGVVWVGTDKNQFWMSKALAYNYNSWMGDLLNDDLLFKEVVLPGSESALMSPKTSDNEELEELISSTLGINQCSECNSVFQHKDVKGQLNAGYRYFETNMSYVTDYLELPEVTDYILNVNVFMNYPIPGICPGGPLEEALDAIKEFLEENESEFVVLNLDQFYLAPGQPASVFSRIAVEKLLDKFLEEIELYEAEEGNDDLNHLFNVPIKELRGKLIITTRDDELAEKYRFFHSIFNSDDNSYNARTNYDIVDINKMFQTQEDFLKSGAEYKRLDWHVNTTALRALCNFKTFGECVEAFKAWSDVAKKKKLSWHLMYATIGCGKELLELGEAVEELTHFDLVPIYVQMMSLLAWINDNASSKNIVRTNQNLPAYLKKWRDSNILNKQNRYNILFTEFSEPWMADLAIMDNVYFNTLEMVTPYNRMMSVDVNHLNADCSGAYNAGLLVEANGGYPPYTYDWSHTNDSSPLLSNLGEGAYEVRVVDKRGHAIKKKIELNANEQSYTQLASSAATVRKFHPKHQSRIYALDCNSLIAKLKSDNSHKPWFDTTTVRLFFDAETQNKYVKRHFDITTAASANGTALMTLYFTPEEFQAYNQQNPAFKLPTSADDELAVNIVIVHQTGRSATGKWNSYSGATQKIYPKRQDIKWNTLSNRWEISFKAKSGGGFFLSTHDGKAANQFIQAKAYVRSGINQVEWLIEERNAQSYYLEMSFDKENFGTVHRILPQGEGRNQYNLQHLNVTLPAGQQMIYYRIRQISKSGKHIFSEILPVNMTQNKPLSIFPNPATDYLNIISNRECQIYISDMSGRKMLEQNISIGQTEINIRTWSKGLYLIRTNDGDVFKVIVN